MSQNFITSTIVALQTFSIENPDGFAAAALAAGVDPLALSEALLDFPSRPNTPPTHSPSGIEPFAPGWSDWWAEHLSTQARQLVGLPDAPLLADVILVLDRSWGVLDVQRISVWKSADHLHDQFSTFLAGWPPVNRKTIARSFRQALGSLPPAVRFEGFLAFTYILATPRGWLRYAGRPRSDFERSLADALLSLH